MSNGGYALRSLKILLSDHQAEELKQISTKEGKTVAELALLALYNDRLLQSTRDFY
jgi:hypothetical protein